jgi:hypothetical protein
LVRYAAWANQDDEKKRDEWVGWYRTIFKRFPQEGEDEKTRLAKSTKVSLFIETLVNKLANSFQKEDVEKAFNAQDTNMIKAALEGVYDMRVRKMGIPMPMKYGFFIEMLKPLIRPHITFMSILNRIEAKRPEVLTFILSTPETLWWFRECIRYAEEFVNFTPEIYMLSKNELAGVVGMGRATEEQMKSATNMLKDETGVEL